MTIKAIETIYKGYKFRSRLEARWAVFFDEMGIEWQYEVEGFELPSGRYLPDFYLPKHGYVEIKAPPRPAHDVPRVYMAGRMAEGGCYRPFDIDSGGIKHLGYQQGQSLAGIYQSIGHTRIIYTGPFRYGSEDHSYVHGAYDGFACPDTENKVLQLSLMGVSRSDVFFALFEDKEAFGTLVELGYAKALGKKIVVGFVHEFAKHPDSDSGYGRTNGFELSRDNDLWFAAMCADQVFSGSRESVLAQFSQLLAEKYPTPREYILALDLARQSKKDVIICYGDPVAAITIDNGCTVSFNEGDDNTLIYPGIVNNDQVMRSATRARQARFEHGQSGAAA